MQGRLFKAALDELETIGEPPVNRVLEVDLDGDEVTLALYNLPSGSLPPNAHRHYAGPQLSSAQNHGGRMPDPAKALQMLNLMEEFFDGGRRWTRGVMHDHRGRHCLLGAMAHIRNAEKIKDDGAEFYLTLALSRTHTFIPAFNDRALSYSAIATLLRKAKYLAKNDLAEQPRRKTGEPPAEVLSKLPEAMPAAAPLTPPTQPLSVPAGIRPTAPPSPIVTPSTARPPSHIPQLPVTIPLAVLKYLSPERLAELRATAPGLHATLDRIERERQRQVTIESLRKSVAEAAKRREPELVA